MLIRAPAASSLEVYLLLKCSNGCLSPREEMLYVLQVSTKQMEIFKVDWGLEMWGENVEMCTLVNGVW